ncbi:MAG: hypothetical protein WBF17_06005, partial [Phycisphaerae bacterium]
MSRSTWSLVGLAIVLACSSQEVSGGGDGTGVRTAILRIADRWVGSWVDKDWDEAKGIFSWRHGPYSDAFEHHYVAAVLLNMPDSKFHRDERLRKRVVSDLLHHSRVFVEQCRDKGLRGYWALNSASDRGIPVGSGSWQSRSYIRACQLLDGQMAPDQKQAWRDGAKWLIAALTVDWKETYGPWWSTNKIADHVAAVALWFQVSGDPKAKEFLDRQFKWFWRAFPEDGFADKYHNYFAKTMYRLAPVLFVPAANRYHGPLLERIRIWRSFITSNGFYDAALHDEPNCEEAWHSKLGPIVSLLLLASTSDPELASVARHIVAQRLADHQAEAFWQKKFDNYFGLHWGSLGLILESAPRWQDVLAAHGTKAPESFERMRFYDYWQGLGRVAVKTERYQASAYLHWAWTWDFAPLGGVLHRVSTPGVFHFVDRGMVARRLTETPRSETARGWLDWDPHQDPETGKGCTALVVARRGDRVDSLPPSFPDEGVATGLPAGRLHGMTHSRYRLGDALEVRTTNVFLNDSIVVLNTVTALEDATFDALYVQQSLANAGELTVRTAEGKAIAFVPDNVQPKPSESYQVDGPFDLRSRDGTGALGFVPLAHSFAKQEVRDIALIRSPYGDRKRVPHPVEAWRGYLPPAVKKGEVLLADFAYVPHEAREEFRPAFRILRTPQAHGVIVPGEPSVAAAQSVGSGGEFTLGKFQCAGAAFAAESAGGQVRKLCLYGQSFSRGGRPVARLTRLAAVTVLPEAG